MVYSSIQGNTQAHTGVHRHIYMCTQDTECSTQDRVCRTEYKVFGTQYPGNRTLHTDTWYNIWDVCIVYRIQCIIYRTQEQHSGWCPGYRTWDVKYLDLQYMI